MTVALTIAAAAARGMCAAIVDKELIMSETMALEAAMRAL
jgi:hypothetical protein